MYLLIFKKIKTYITKACYIVNKVFTVGDKVCEITHLNNVKEGERK